ncbi:MAG: molybdopterin-binding protein, partial [Deltaproteobacteria bacterium]|nr:molybdopterin-binding protein [Deltaproteobacteria bacterium]
MLKVIPVEKAVGTLLAHDVTEIVPGKHKRPAFRRGHRVTPEDVPKLLDIGKSHLYIMELEEGELHEEDAARRLALTSAGPHIRLTEPMEGRVNLVAEISGLLKIDKELLYRFNALGNLILSTLPSNQYVKEGEVVAGTRTIPLVINKDLVEQAEAICKNKPIVTILPLPSRRIHLI